MHAELEKNGNGRMVLWDHTYGVYAELYVEREGMNEAYLKD